MWYHCNFGVAQAVRWLHGTGPDDARIGEGNAAQMIDFESMPRCREVWRDSTGDGLEDTQCIFLSLRGINTSHALAASRVLARFAAVIPLEDLGGAGARLLQQKVGWRGCPRRTNAHSGAVGGANGGGGKGGGGKAGGGRRRLAQRQALGARSLQTLRELNRFDIGLHEQARRELRGRAAAAMAPVDCSAPAAATGHGVRELGCVR